MQPISLTTISVSKKEAIVIAICYAFIILFLYAGFYKLFDFSFFKVSLAHSPLIGRFSGFLAYAVPLGEIGVSVLLFTKHFRLLALWLSTAIMVGFTAYIIYIIYFSPHIPCNCGGILQRMSWRQHLVFNIFFVVLGMVGIFFEKSRRMGAG